jgi:hypothetical protein
MALHDLTQGNHKVGNKYAKYYMSPENIKHIDSVACRALFHFCNELIHRLERTRCGGYDNTMGDGSCTPLAATLAGDVLRTAAYAFWKAARKLRWVGKGIRAGGGPEARPQGGAREAAAPTAEASGLQPARDDGANVPSGHQRPGAATRAL